MRRKIKKLHPTILSADDVLVIAKNVASITGRHCAGNTAIEEIINDITTGIQRLQVVLIRTRASKFTSQLKMEDKERQKALLSLKHFLRSWMYRSNKPQGVAGARKIYALIKQIMPDIKNFGYANGSIYLPILLQRLQWPEFQKAIENIDGQHLVENLKNAYDTFEATYNKRVKSEAEADTTKKDEAKDAVLYYLNILFTNVEYQKDKMGGPFTRLIEMFNDVISDITAVARARKTRQAKGEQEQGHTHTQVVLAA